MDAQRHDPSHVTWRRCRFDRRTTTANDADVVAGRRPRARPGPGSILGLLATVLVFAAAEPARAWTPKMSLLAPWSYSPETEDTYIQFGLLAQIMYEAKEANAGHFNEATMERDSWSNALFVRRIRMLVQGAFHKSLLFFVSSDSPNLWKNNNSNELFLNDAFLEVKLIPQVNILAGRLLSPFSFENLQPAGALLGIDYTLNALKLPLYVKAPYRDNGVALTGVLFQNWIEYRAGVFAASRHEETDHGAHAWGPRFTGRVMLNLAGPQNGWFYFVNSLGTKTTSSIGAGFDYQKNGGPMAGLDYQAWVVDAVVDRTLGSTGQVLSFAFAYYDWRHASDNFTGNTAAVTGGWLLWGRVQPVLRWEHQSPDHASDLDTYHVGLNVYILKPYTLNVKADWAFGDRRDAAGHYQNAARVQVQVLL